jgi:transposase
MTVLGLLDERRNNLVTQRTRLVNQLHALLRDLLPGGAPTDLTASTAGHLLARIRPVGQVEAARKHLARDVVDEIRDKSMRKCARSMARDRPDQGEGSCSGLPSEGGSARSNPCRGR